MTEISPAARLVLACARVAPSQPQLARVAELAALPLDWNAALRLATRHGLAPVVQRNLAAAGAIAPQRIAAALWARAEWAARRSRALAGELERIAQAFVSRGIHFVPFKGPLLAERVHGDVALREFGDLDLLIAPADVRRAWTILAALGYETQAGIPAGQEDLWLESAGRHELPMADVRRGFLVEMQWRSNPGFAVPALDDAAWWDAAPRSEWRGIPLRTLPDDENLLALLVHGSKHSWGSADWLVDIAALAADPSMPWDSMLRLAAKNHAKRRAALGLELAHTLLEVALPASAADFVSRAGVGSDVQAIGASLLDDVPASPSVVGGLRTELRLCDGNAQRLARLVALLRPTPGDWQARRLPRALWPLYWLLRPARLFAKYVLRLPRREIPAAATPRTPRPQPHSTS